MILKKVVKKILFPVNLDVLPYFGKYPVVVESAHLFFPLFFLKVAIMAARVWPTLLLKKKKCSIRVKLVSLFFFLLLVPPTFLGHYISQKMSIQQTFFLPNLPSWTVIVSSIYLQVVDTLYHGRVSPCNRPPTTPPSSSSPLPPPVGKYAHRK